MTDKVLKPLPLTPERFAAYGDVIETSASSTQGMNDARFERFDKECTASTPWVPCSRMVRRGPLQVNST